MSDYEAFLASKAVSAPMRGVANPVLTASHLFPFQAACVQFLLRVGSGGLFLDTGLGKTAVELEWCWHAGDETNKPTLILTPLAVARQIEREGKRWGYTCKVIRDQSEMIDGINICNYDRLDKLDPHAYGAVALDEASILKSFTGKTTRALIQAFAGHRFRLVATATPAPNDHMELGNYAEFCGIMAANEMLMRWFINDTSTASQEWRLKAHAVESFWDWMASWCRMAEKPADLGDTSVNFDLPPLNVTRHHAGKSPIKGLTEGLFETFTLSATNLHEVKRQTSEARAAKCAELIAADPAEPWVIWCDTDYESDALRAAIPTAVDVKGSMPVERKESILADFAEGRLLHLIGKPSMLGYGLNWQHCARMAFVGRSYSYETWYQAVRRCWRFGQKRPVNVHLIVAEGEDEIGRVINRKADGHASMKLAMQKAMARATGTVTRVRIAYDAGHKAQLPIWMEGS